MHNQQETHSALKTIAVGALAAGALAFCNHLVARRTERRHPPEGSFVVVDGVRLHYSDRGHGRPVVLIHGNAVTGADWNTSGVADLLVPAHRVIIFSTGRALVTANVRGIGSGRPRGRPTCCTKRSGSLASSGRWWSATLGVLSSRSLLPPGI